MMATVRNRQLDSADLHRRSLPRLGRAHLRFRPPMPLVKTPFPRVDRPVSFDV